MPGTLFVVATPIGNLEDLSFRALRVLKEVQLIAAEDTRRTAKLLAHYEIRCSVVSLREHNERRETPRLLARLAAGDSVALVSDAGTPTVSDPGAGLVRAARTQGIPVVPIPGPSAVTTALSASGFPGDAFLFLGFPPRGGRARETWLSRLAQAQDAVVFFEAPHRIRQTLAEVSDTVVKRPILIFREITKKHEEYVEYTSQTAVQDRGEFTVVVGPARSVGNKPEIGPDSVAALVDFLSGPLGQTREEAEIMAARTLASDVRAIRSTVKKHRILVKRHND